MTEIQIARPDYPILFGGFGFHNSEALFYRLIEKEHFDQKICKCYRELSPGFMRTFAGYPVQPSTTLSAAMPSRSRYPWVEKMWPGYSRRSVHGWRRELLPASKEAMRETCFAVSSSFFWLAS